MIPTTNTPANLPNISLRPVVETSFSLGPTAFNRTTGGPPLARRELTTKAWTAGEMDAEKRIKIAAPTFILNFSGSLICGGSDKGYILYPMCNKLRLGGGAALLSNQLDWYPRERGYPL
mmetsp:Transcript_539/g.940  ORF Transcript_539/g.940 Transcript_539/m.940 type:complete len:119 (+) Transcript_539:1110-1466(+)